MYVHRADDGIIRSLDNPDSIRPADHFAGRISFMKRMRGLVSGGSPD
jgi:hypothetical protein